MSDNQKKYMSIERLKLPSESGTGNIMGFTEKDHIVIQEKIDGANGSFRYNPKLHEVEVFSRNTKLNEFNTLRGFYGYIKNVSTQIVSKYPMFIFFGEWLVSHRVKYEEDMYNEFYLFDVFDISNNKYLSWNRVYELAIELGLKTVPILYDGVFISWEHCKSIITDKMEGVIIKNQDHLNGSNFKTDIKLPFYIKIINNKYSEITNKPNKLRENNVESEKIIEAKTAIEQIVTESRVHKEIFKMIDEGILPEDLSPENMGVIAKHLPKRVYNDCAKEEPELVNKYSEYFGKILNKIAMSYARKIVIPT